MCNLRAGTVGKIEKRKNSRADPCYIDRWGRVISCDGRRPLGNKRRMGSGQGSRPDLDFQPRPSLQ